MTVPIFTVADAWRSGHAGAVVGALALGGVANPSRHPALDAAKGELEQTLRERFGQTPREQLKTLEPIAAYEAYYRRFRKTYHVRHQLESVVHDGKPIPSRAALVEAMFMTELKNQLLTAGHDLDELVLPARLDSASGDERYVAMNESEQVCKAGDMMIADGEGVISSIVAGPDRRTRITASTTRALFTVYAPPGVSAEAVERHLADITANARIISPQVEVIESRVVTASG
jgi:DNA/RNA-binding domain of Phe-tRNA-synthetase-like protein